MGLPRNFSFGIIIIRAYYNVKLHTQEDNGLVIISNKINDNVLGLKSFVVEIIWT